MKKVLLITETLPHYRVELFNFLCKDYIFTIAHSGKEVANAEFYQHKLKILKKGPFLQLEELPDTSSFDVVIFTFNIRILNLYKLLFARRNYKLLLFGIGVSASYNSKYDQNKKLDFLRKLFIKKFDGVIFYEYYPLIKYQSQKINSNKLYVAYNTVVPPKDFNFNLKTYESFIFIGGLYKAKKIYNLLDAYLSVFNKLKEYTPKLEIIGDGEEREVIKNWIQKNNLNNNIVLHGKINEDELLKPIFYRAIACVSPGQAGLSVQKCFSYGVPFITSKDAITGGEIFSIINQENGFLYNGSVDELSAILLQLSNNKVRVKEMSSKAYAFYYNFRTPTIWANAFKNAIK